MPFRVTDSATNASLEMQLAASRARLASAQERVATGKRINRPSDDPSGAGAVVTIRATQASVAQFQRNVGEAGTALEVNDGALDQYQLALDRAKTLLVQGVTDTTTTSARQSLAVEIDGLRQRILGLADSRNGDEYVFGGTRQDVPPYDPVTATPAATPAARRQVQVEPGRAPIDVGVTGEEVFGSQDDTIFNLLSNAAAALRGTGNQAADTATLHGALDRLDAFQKQTSTARAVVGANISTVDSAGDRLTQSNLALEERAQRFETADFAEAAIELTSSEKALEAILQSAAHTGKRTLVDFLG